MRNDNYDRTTAIAFGPLAQSLGLTTRELADQNGWEPEYGPHVKRPKDAVITIHGVTLDLGKPAIDGQPIVLSDNYVCIGDTRIPKQLVADVCLVLQRLIQR